MSTVREHANPNNSPPFTQILLDMHDFEANAQISGRWWVMRVMECEGQGSHVCLAPAKLVR